MSVHKRTPGHKRFVVDVPRTRSRGVSRWRYLVGLTRDGAVVYVKTTVGAPIGDRGWKHYRTVYRAEQNKPAGQMVRDAIEAARTLQREEGVPL